MRIVGRYSFNHGKEVVRERYPTLLEEVEEIVCSINASLCLTKKSKEKTMLGKLLYSPRELNRYFKTEFKKKNWQEHKIYCEYPIEYYEDGYAPNRNKKNQRPYREIDFVKQKLGIEVQFGKYAFMVYNVAAKMTIFRNLGIIDTGIEIVPVKAFADTMSTGVSYFEQFVWDLEKRGVSNIDVPVLILGIDVQE